MVYLRVLLVIPARYKSTRLPGKPLADLCGLPLVRHVWERCRQAVDSSDILVATDDHRIADVASGFGAQVEMTSPDCPTGTDRVAEVATRHVADWYINVQGDEPFVQPSAIRLVKSTALSSRPEIAAINTMSVITNEPEFRSETVPKPVTGASGRLLYMSRAGIPTDKQLRFQGAFRQVGLYAFRPSALALYAPGAKKSQLESIEDIELLRVVEAGLWVQMLEVPPSGIAVDTPEDLNNARRLIRGDQS